MHWTVYATKLGKLTPIAINHIYAFDNNNMKANEKGNS